MRRTGALAAALSSAALLGFTALAAAPAAEGRGGDEMPYGVDLRMHDDGSVSVVALTEDDIDDESGHWHSVG